MIKSWKILQQSSTLTNRWNDKQLSKDLPKLKKKLSPLRKTWARKHFNLPVRPSCTQGTYVLNSFLIPTHSYIYSSSSIKLYNKPHSYLQSKTTWFIRLANFTNTFKLLNLLRLIIQTNLFILPSFVHLGSSSRLLPLLTKSFNFSQLKLTAFSNHAPLNFLRLKNL